MSRSVLIVDDHASFRRFARRSLEQAGFEVVGEAATGRARSRRRAGSRRTSFSWTCCCPTCRDSRSRRLAPCESTRVVLTSSRGADEFGVALDEAEADGFIPKNELSGASLARLLAA